MPASNQEEVWVIVVGNTERKVSFIGLINLNYALRMNNGSIIADRIEKS